MAASQTSTGAFNSGTAGITLAFGAGAAAGNYGALFFESANQVAIAPSGWSDNFQQGFGTAGAAAATLIGFFTKTSITSGDIASGIAFPDTGDHQGGVLLTFSGLDGTTPFVVTQSGQSTSTSNTAVALSTPVNTTTITPNDIVLAVICTDRDSASAATITSPAWANIAGSRSTIVNASTTSGQGGGIIIDQLIPSGTQTAAVTFSATITGSAYTGRIVVLKGAAGSVSPSAGHLALSGKTPSVVVNFNVSPSAGHITLGGKVSSVTVGSSLSPAKGSIVLGGKQPSISLTIGVSPSVGHLTFSGKVPSVTRTTAVSPAVGHLALTGKTPTVVLGVNVAPSTGHLTLTGHVPPVSYTLRVSPSSGHIVLSGKVPSISLTSGLTPTTGHFAYSGKAPTITTALNPAPGHIVLSGHVAAAGLEAGPSTGHIRISGYAPTIVFGAVVTKLWTEVPPVETAWNDNAHASGSWAEPSRSTATWTETPPVSSGWDQPPKPGTTWN